MSWNRLRHFHRDPKVIAAWRKPLGPVLRWLTPGRRRFLLALGAIYVAVERPLHDLSDNKRTLDAPPDLLSSILLVCVLFGFVCFCYAAAKKFASLPGTVRRHPQMALHAIFWALLLLLWTTPIQNPTIRTVLAGCVFTLPFLLWRVGYMMFTAQRGKMTGTRFKDHLVYIFPAWNGGDAPHGKGWDYLSANEARDEEALAKSQLAGVKLFLLAAIFSVGGNIMDGLVFGEDNAIRRALGFSLGVPVVNELYLHPETYPLWLKWVALYLDLVRRVLSLCSKGHVVIGWLRFFGFNVFRNSYKPLLTETIVEFWNRYYYYFKELMVNFFFYPTFTRHFKTHPRLRMFAAVFMAAFAGNMYYHWLGQEHALVTGDFLLMWTTLQSRLFYCFLLAVGIWLSMLREQRRAGIKPPRTFLRRAVAIFGVWTFFSIIHIWDQKDQILFVTRTKFFLGLMGLD